MDRTALRRSDVGVERVEDGGHLPGLEMCGGSRLLVDLLDFRPPDRGGMGRTQDFLPNPGKRGAFYNGMVVALQVRKMGPIRNAGPRSSERCRRLAKSAASRQVGNRQGMAASS